MTIKEEVRAILGSMEHPEDVLLNLPELYSQDCDKSELLKEEMKKLSLPFNFRDVTEMCDTLDKFQRVINY